MTIGPHSIAFKGPRRPVDPSLDVPPPFHAGIDWVRQRAAGELSGGAVFAEILPAFCWLSASNVPYAIAASRRRGSSALVLRSTPRMIVRWWRPSALLATTGITWRRSGNGSFTAKRPSSRTRTGSP